MTFVCYPKCSTCKKAQDFLTNKGVTFEIRHIKEQTPTEEEIRLWHTRSGLDLKKFFNTSGLQYRALELKDKLKDMTDDEKYALLASDGMLIKRPILISDDFVLLGFKSAQWEETL